MALATRSPDQRQTGRGTSPARRKNGRKADTRDAWGFILPFLVVYALFLLAPVLQAIYTSLFNWDLLSTNRLFIGAENFVRMLWGTGMTWDLTHFAVARVLLLLVVVGAWLAVVAGKVPARVAAVTTGGIAVFVVVLGIHPGPGGRWNDAAFWSSFAHTLQFTFISTPLLVGVGLAMALALNSKRRGIGFYRAAFFVPYVLPVSVVTLIWGYLLNPDRGILASFLARFGIEPISWLTSPSLAMPAIIVTTIWWTVGFNLVLFLAGLQDIDPALYEAASLDGASNWAKFRYVTVPGLQRVTTLVIVAQVIASFQIFGQVYIMTRGGPGGSTRVLIQHVYEAGFRDFQLGYASAVSLFLFVVMLAASAIQLRFMREDH